MIGPRFFYAFYLLFYSTGGFSEREPLQKHDMATSSPCQSLHVEILVSPLVSKTVLRRLEIQWEYAPNNPGDWVGLFRGDPLPPGVPPNPVEVFSVNTVHGWVNTSVFEDHVEPELLGFHARCLDYYAAYLDSKNNTLAATCLRTEPTWMWNLKEEIAPRRVRSVFIPGTHDSAAYGEFDENIGDTIVKKYSITQDETILAQLIYGIRYIDLRVGYYQANAEPWWANHGIVRIHPLRLVLRDIRNFLMNTNEIVVLDIQEFPVGFDKNEVHYSLVKLLREEVGEFAVSATLDWDSTFGEVWSTGKQLIIAYDYRDVVLNSNFVWYPIQQKWGNVQTLDKLYTYIAGIIQRPPIAAWAAMAELTPTTIDVFLDRLKGLRVMAESVNHNVTAWFRRKDWRSRTNVVAVDFFRNTGIVRSAIEWNKHLGHCSDG